MERLYAIHQQLLIHLKPLYRNEIIDQLPWNDRLLGIVGARGVGKTTLMLQYILEKYQDDRKALYVSLDDISFPFDSLINFADDFVKIGGKHLFIDEIHKYYHWSLELKNIYDRYPDLKVTFSGSSILDIYKSTSDLSRRALVFTLHGLSFRQYLQIETGLKFPVFSLEEILLNHQKISYDINVKIKPFAFFSDYLKHGYYPFYLQNKEFYAMRLSNTLNQIVETDLPLIQSIDLKNINKLKRFIHILAREIPYKPNISKLSTALEISWQTIILYLNYLEKARIISMIYPMAKNVSLLSKPEKIFLQNPNLFYVFKNTIDNKGSVRESFFISQMVQHTITIPKYGDFMIDEKYVFEIGGKNKTYHQIADTPHSFIASDDVEFGNGNKIPLWLFGFLY